MALQLLTFQQLRNLHRVGHMIPGNHHHWYHRPTLYIIEAQYVTITVSASVISKTGRYRVVKIALKTHQGLATPKHPQLRRLASHQTELVMAPT